MTSALDVCTRHRRTLVKCPNERGRDIWVREAQDFMYEQEALPPRSGGEALYCSASRSREGKRKVAQS